MSELRVCLRVLGWRLVDFSLTWPSHEDDPGEPDRGELATGMVIDAGTPPLGLGFTVPSAEPLTWDDAQPLRVRVAGIEPATRGL